MVASNTARTFDVDHSRGQKIERLVAKALKGPRAIGPPLTVYSYSAGAAFDLWAADTQLPLLVECKDESNQLFSENLCVECWQGTPRRASGITLSESTIYVHYFSDDDIYVFRTAAMRTWLQLCAEEHGIRHRPFHGKAQNNAAGFLVPKRLVAGQCAIDKHGHCFFGPHRPWCEQVTLATLRNSPVLPMPSDATPHQRSLVCTHTGGNNPMADFNRVILIGRLTRDPELRYTPSQMAVCDFGIATDRHWTDKDGQKREETAFVNCTAWGGQAETIQKYMNKGRPIFIEGRLTYDQWDGPDGKKRSKVGVTVERFQFLGGRGDGADEPAAKPAPATQNAGAEGKDDDETIPF